MNASALFDYGLLERLNGILRRRGRAADAPGILLVPPLDPALPAAKWRFVGKRAQHRMHVACNDRLWFAAAADKLLFQSLMEGIDLPVPELRAVTQTRADCAARRADHHQRRSDRHLAVPARGVSAVHQAGRRQPTPSTQPLTGAPARRRPRTGGAIGREPGLWPGLPHPATSSADARLASRFGPRLWSLRALVLLRPSGPIIHRAVAKIATGNNPADKYGLPATCSARSNCPRALSPGRSRGLAPTSPSTPATPTPTRRSRRHKSRIGTCAFR